MHSRTSALAIAVGLAAAIVVACHSAPPPPPAPPVPLSDSGAAALKWVESQAVPFQPADSVASAAERTQLMALAANARVIGFSELTEGTHQFPYIVRRSLIALADSSHVRGLAIQAPMAEAMEVDRYVRTGVGDPQRWLRTLGAWRWETHEMRGLVEAIRAWNHGRATGEQIGFYGFEIPSAEHAVAVIAALHDSITGPALKSWLARQYSCVAINEGAHWGLEGRTADSLYWRACEPATSVALDSIVALRHRVNSSSRAAVDVAFAEQMARLIQHHVHTGLAHLARQNLNAEHVLFLVDALGPDAKLMLWGGDVEMGRLTLDKQTVQTAVPLSEKLGDHYRAIAFAFGDGVVRTRSASGGRGGQPPGLSDVTVGRPLPDTYENVFTRVAREGYWLDMRSLPSDVGGVWLRGPHPMRLISDLYSTSAPELFQTPVEFPKFFDAVVFVKHPTPAKQ